MNPYVTVIAVAENLSISVDQNGDLRYSPYNEYDEPGELLEWSVTKPVELLSAEALMTVKRAAEAVSDEEIERLLA